MLRCLKFLPVFLLLALLTACGSKGVDATTVSGIAAVPFVDGEVNNKTLYLVSATDNQVTTSVPDSDSLLGGILYRGAKQIAGIQKEADYWLVYDRNDPDKKISRLYLDQASADLYFNSKSIMGGSIQGSTLPLGNPVTVSLFAGTPGIVGSATGFNMPTGITTVGTFLYVADYNNNVIRQIDASGNPIIFAGNPLLMGSTNGDRLTEATFNHPSDITTDGKNLYITDSGNFMVRMIDLATQKVSTVAGFAGTSGAVDAIGTAARFNYLAGITTDGTNLYVTDSYNTIRKIVIGTKVVSTLAGSAGSVGFVDGIGATARFNLPAHITTDGSNLYVTDFENRTIRRVSIATGEVLTIVGNANVAPGTTDATGEGSKALFYHLDGITSDGAYLYVTDSYNNTVYKIQKISPWQVTKLAGITGTAGYVNGPSGDTSVFDTPRGVTTNGTSLYVVDSRNNVIRKID